MVGELTTGPLSWEIFTQAKSQVVADQVIRQLSYTVTFKGNINQVNI